MLGPSRYRKCYDTCRAVYPNEFNVCPKDLFPLQSITDTLTPDAYDIDLSVTDSKGTTGATFPGVATSETDLGYTFGFGPVVIDGVTGTAAGYLTPDGKAMSGSFTAPGAAGWSMSKQ